MDYIFRYPKNDKRLLEIETEADLEKIFKPEFVPIMWEHIKLQKKWRLAVYEAKIDLYSGEFLSIDWLAETFRDKVLWDIGCSVGMWAIAALECGARKVYGFDPLPENRVDEDDDRFTRFVTKVGIEPSIDLIATTTLSKPDIIKIDVEGEELQVLLGAERTIKKFRPILVIEIHEVLNSKTSEEKVTGNKKKVMDLLRPWIGEPSEIIDQNINDLGNIYHLIYVPSPS